MTATFQHMRKPALAPASPLTAKAITIKDLVSARLVASRHDRIWGLLSRSLGAALLLWLFVQLILDVI